MNLQDRIELMEEAQQHISDAIDCIKSAIEGSSSRRNIETYLLATLKVAASTGEYMSQDQSVKKVIEMLREEFEDEDSDEGPTNQDSAQYAICHNVMCERKLKEEYLCEYCGKCDDCCKCGEDDTEDAEPVDGFDDDIDWYDLAHKGKSMDSPDVYGN